MDILESMLQIMENIEKEYKGSPGRRKKQVVLEILKTAVIAKWGLDYWEKWKDTIPPVIDLLCSISNKEITLHLNNIKGCLPCLY